MTVARVLGCGRCRRWNPAILLFLSLLWPGCGDGTTEAFDLADGISISQQTYADRLRAMWLGESIANWTGLVTEAKKISAPFFTDEDWGTRRGNSQINGTGIIEFVFQDPWGSDDDTDIEYIYLDAMAGHGHSELTAEEIREAWNTHIEPRQFIWVSNLEAHTLMLGDPYALPPSTSLFPANDQSLMIDAQLTTEMFGALAPGLPAEALRIADLPIRVTASGHAAHAAQFFVTLYSLALFADPELPMGERILWLVRTARRVIPDTSKTADVIDFVVADYLENPDIDDWERTRDAVAARYQQNAAANGFQYIDFYESSVNLATGLLALLYGEGDFRRTVQIGTLSGWDSDNGTATMGGLLGLMLGTEELRAAFPDTELADEYDISRTRIGFDLTDGVDTFSAMAARMMPLVESQIVRAGGVVDDEAGAWIIPVPELDTLDVGSNPLTAVDASSANNHLHRVGDVPEVSLTGVDATGLPWNGESSHIADGVECDFSGSDRRLPARSAVEWIIGQRPETLYFIAPLANGAEEIAVAVTWQSPLEIAAVRFVEGPHFLEPDGELLDGGWFETVTVELLVDSEWVAEEGSPVTGEPSSRVSFEIIEWMLPSPVFATGVRLRGSPGGSGRFATIAELEGVLP